MTKILVPLDRIYNLRNKANKKDVSFKYLNYLKKQVEGFRSTKIAIKKLRNFDKRYEVVISGPEENFVYNLLSKEIGAIKDFESLKVGDIIKGYLINVGNVGFGLFADCGIFNPPTDVLIHLQTLRKQLCNDQKISLRKIVDIYDFIDFFPIYLKINLIDETKGDIAADIADRTLKLFSRVVNEDIEALLITGATKNQIKTAIERKGHFQDVISVKRFGYLEHVALLKENTEAPGIIANIGNRLENCNFSAIRPGKIREYFK